MTWCLAWRLLPASKIIISEKQYEEANDEVVENDQNHQQIQNDANNLVQLDEINE